MLALQNLEFLSQIRRELQREGYVKTPKVFIHPSCSGDMPRLQRIVDLMGGELMPSESAPLPSDIENEYMMVHNFGICNALYDQSKGVRLPASAFHSSQQKSWASLAYEHTGMLLRVPASPFAQGYLTNCVFNAETPGVTHIVYPFGPKGDVDDGVEYIRSLEKRYCNMNNNALFVMLLCSALLFIIAMCTCADQSICLYCRGTDVLVHYWYYPDSYDRCLAANVAPETIESEKRIKGELSL